MLDDTPLFLCGCLMLRWLVPFVAVVGEKGCPLSLCCLVDHIFLSSIKMMFSTSMGVDVTVTGAVEVVMKGMLVPLLDVFVNWGFVF